MIYELDAKELQMVSNFEAKGTLLLDLGFLAKYRSPYNSLKVNRFASLIFPIFWVFSLLGVTPIPISNHLNPGKTTEVEQLLENLSATHPNPPSQLALAHALRGYQQLSNGLKKPVLTVIDFTLPSTQRRLWIIDMEAQKILLHTVVAHGRNSGLLHAEQFSNRPESYQSSLGFFKTGETYQGKHGYSLRLDGLEKGINDQARNRAIVLHGADYAKEEFLKSAGRLGRSLGCPAVPTELATSIIQLIKEGTLLFVYGKDPDYLETSKF